jgi:hypothetical protein
MIAFQLMLISDGRANSLRLQQQRQRPLQQLVLQQVVQAGGYCSRRDYG